MKYIVTVSDTATYTIDASDEREAKDQALQWFTERDHVLEVKEVPEFKVEQAPLQEVIEMWVQTFNDCACCPCERCSLDFGADACECADQIITRVLKAKEVIE